MKSDRERESIALEALTIRLYNYDFDADKICRDEWDIHTTEYADGRVEFGIKIPGSEVIKLENFYGIVREDDE